MNPDESKSAEFFSRQIVLPELTRRGQDRLQSSHVVVVGLGGLGSVATLFLALAGVGKLTLIDQDTVELNNLHRQVLYSLSDIRTPKVEAASLRVAEISPYVEMVPVAENLRASNVEEFLRNADCVVDGLDNMSTRYLLNRASIRLGIPFVFGGAIGLEGNLSVFEPPDSACLECIMPNIDDSTLPTCDTRGVVGATTGVIGSLEAMEAIKLVAGIGQPLKNKILIFDFHDMDVRTIQVQSRADCSACQSRTPELPRSTEKLAWLCGSDTANVNPHEKVSISFEEAERKLKPDAKVLLTTKSVLVFEFGRYEVSLFKTGRMLIKNVRNEEEALTVHEQVLAKVRG